MFSQKSHINITLARIRVPMGLFLAFSIAQELEFPFLFAFFFLGLIVFTKRTLNIADAAKDFICVLLTWTILVKMIIA